MNPAVETEAAQKEARTKEAAHLVQKVRSYFLHTLA